MCLVSTIVRHRSPTPWSLNRRRDHVEAMPQLAWCAGTSLMRLPADGRTCCAPIITHRLIHSMTWCMYNLLLNLVSFDYYNPDAKGCVAMCVSNAMLIYMHIEEMKKVKCWFDQALREWCADLIGWHWQRNIETIHSTNCTSWFQLHCTARFMQVKVRYDPCISIFKTHMSASCNSTSPW